MAWLLCMDSWEIASLIPKIYQIPRVHPLTLICLDLCTLGLSIWSSIAILYEDGEQEGRAHRNIQTRLTLMPMQKEHWAR